LGFEILKTGFPEILWTNFQRFTAALKSNTFTPLHLALYPV
jgi:hypothetical protein